MLRESPIVDTLASNPILVAAGSDGRSARALARVVEGQTLDLYLDPGGHFFRLVDSQTGSRWDFSGKAVHRPLAGKQLQALKD